MLIVLSFLYLQLKQNDELWPMQGRILNSSFSTSHKKLTNSFNFLSASLSNNNIWILDSFKTLMLDVKMNINGTRIPYTDCGNTTKCHHCHQKFVEKFGADFSEICTHCSKTSYQRCRVISYNGMNVATFTPNLLLIQL